MSRTSTGPGDSSWEVEAGDLGGAGAQRVGDLSTWARPFDPALVYDRQ